ncbi:MAG TPA: class I SAM-dependent methyltransferase [Xanthomonadaceae bacterium]|nr:class I SAM-dependent methyltransferase [Xanthomonadaceae bacterium]
MVAPSAVPPVVPPEAPQLPVEASPALYQDLAAVHLAFYGQGVVPGLDVAFFRAALAATAATDRLLLIGSYSAVLPAALAHRLTVCDLNPDMLAEAVQRWPRAGFLQADVRRLPLAARFAAILMPGAVTAHLLTDADVAAATTSLAAALVPGGQLRLDAYLPDIARTPHFNGVARFDVSGDAWTRQATLVDVDPSDGCLQVDLSFVDPAGRVACCERLSQRTFGADALIAALEDHGLRCLERTLSPSTGRLYLGLRRV